MVSARESQRPSKDRGRCNIASVACNRCRRRKTKCSEDRPSCRKCRETGVVCVYEAHPNESRHAALRRKNEELRQQLAQANDRVQSVHPAVPDEAARADGELSSKLSSRLSATSDTASPASVASPTSPDAMSHSYGSSQESSFKMGLCSRSPSPVPGQSDSPDTTCMALIHALISTTDDESTMILAKLRVGIPASRILHDLATPTHSASPVTPVKVEIESHQQTDMFESSVPASSFRTS